ncbi:MAG: LVIVD repeat-containing protein [Gaiellaceae bacterium]
MALRRPLVMLIAVAATLTVSAAGALACAVHMPLSPSSMTPLDALFAPSATAATPRAPARYRLRAVGHADPAAGYNGDVWAHRGHAYLSSWGGPACPSDGVRVYSLANPRRPVLVSTFASDELEPALKSTWTEKTIVQHVATPAFTGELAVTSVQSCKQGAFRGFALYDVTDSRAPRTLALVRTEPRGSHELWLQPRSGAAYVYTAIIDSELRSSPDHDPSSRTARTPGRPDFRVYDVTSPTAPVEVGSWGVWRDRGVYPHPADPAEGGGITYVVHSVTSNAAGTRAYLSYWDLGTVILDTTNPAAPRYLGRTPDTEAAHSAALGNSGKLLIETHETAGGVPHFFDVSNPARPRRLGSLRIAAAGRPAPFGARSLMNGVHDADVRGKRAFFSWYTQGVVAADITRPARPRVIAQWLPPVGADEHGALCQSGACRAVWGVATSGDYVLASDLVTGLWVLKLERPK